MIHLPKAQEVFDEEGCVVQESEQAQWDEYSMNRTFHQLMWWAQGAARKEKILIQLL